MKNIIIGNANGYEVRYSKHQELVYCIGVNVVIYNVKSLEQAYELAERNFKNFKRV